ncbi:hypothetical protein CK203_065294 [Vitis vinifera]|uniref:Retrovirus-related Pol polyprotein from transposon RE1 n=1 Tax=Vitis vinifera TaxID=29760 RepID=A0A438H5K9_VITVI|nr:hypothetical protein CK203_065294 [Vitis vinifera]
MSEGVQLKKSLYGLKQSSRAWFGRFTKSMRAFGYRQSNSDHTLFLKSNMSIEVYTDADWAGAVDDRRSTSGYFTFVGAACDIAHNPVQHDYTKHVEVDRFFIKEKFDDKIVELPEIRSEDQLADILTKLSQVKCSQNF